MITNLLQWDNGLPEILRKVHNHKHCCSMAEGYCKLLARMIDIEAGNGCMGPGQKCRSSSKGG